jgi:serine/threonine-protein phosphatase 2A activator
MTEFPSLQKIADVQTHQFEKPVKKIYDGPDVSFFHTTFAYRDIMIFMLQLNRSMVPRIGESGSSSSGFSTWPLQPERRAYSNAISRLRTLLDKLSTLIDETSPDTGPRRFGNVSFRKWYLMVEGRVRQLLAECLSSDLASAHDELSAYLLGSFGSPQRLDYGTGHELSFLAFLACLWKLSFFPSQEPGVAEREIVLGVFESYLIIVRKLIKLYNLEPAGSHGVWGLDDNSFLPYVFGSAQLCPPIRETDVTPVEGSLSNAPDPASVAKQNLVDKEKDSNMYFSAIAFIYDVKKGPFWEHSPMLFDISGIKDGWGKINKGMIKMYNAEVLSKFPVVQHFPFGSLFRWEKDPEAKPPPPSTHANSQPLRNPTDTHAPSTLRQSAAPMPTTAAPWARPASAAPAGFVNGVTQAPWANRNTGRPPPLTGTLSQARRQPMPSLNESEARTTPQNSAGKE